MNPYHRKETFDDWTIDRDYITAPNGIRWTPDQLNAWHYEKQLLAELKRQLMTPSQLSF